MYFEPSKISLPVISFMEEGIHIFLSSEEVAVYDTEVAEDHPLGLFQTDLWVTEDQEELVVRHGLDCLGIVVLVLLYFWIVPLDIQPIGFAIKQVE